MVALSVLELGRVRQGSTAKVALDEAQVLAKHVEALGYTRFWVAEHHNFPGVTTAATSIVVAHVASATTTLRVGAGGIMLPNHAPYVIAEQFGTLATLYPDRIDLGLGRAPGTDQVTVRALRRTTGADTFPDDVQELQMFLGPSSPGQRVEAHPGVGTRVPLWILGSSTFGARLAAKMGLPFGFASHFAPGSLDAALDIYRSEFRPSAQLDAPYVLVGLNVIAAQTDDEARRLATSQQMSFCDIFRGARGLLQPPIDDIDRYWSPQERAQAGHMLACTVFGGPTSVRTGLKAFIQRTGADELMVVSDIFDPALRRRSFAIIAEANDTRPPAVA